MSANLGGFKGWVDAGGDVEKAWRCPIGPDVRYRAVLFDVGGAIDLEFAWEMAVDGAIAAACGMEGVRVDQAMVEAASDEAVAAFATDTCGHMIETLCGGEPVTISARAPAGRGDDWQARCLSAAAGD